MTNTNENNWILTFAKIINQHKVMFLSILPIFPILVLLYGLKLSNQKVSTITIQSGYGIHGESLEQTLRELAKKGVLTEYDPSSVNIETNMSYIRKLPSRAYKVIEIQIPFEFTGKLIDKKIFLDTLLGTIAEIRSLQFYETLKNRYLHPRYLDTERCLTLNQLIIKARDYSFACSKTFNSELEGLKLSKVCHQLGVEHQQELCEDPFISDLKVQEENIKFPFKKYLFLSFIFSFFFTFFTVIVFHKE